MSAKLASFFRRTRALLTLGTGVLGLGVFAGVRAPPPPLLRHLPPVPTLNVPAARGASSPGAEPSPRFAAPFDVSTFLKGNIHAHTTRSDGDRSPQVVYAWYRDHGYAFLAVTDHNILTDPAIYRLLERAGHFLMIPGEEVSMLGGGKQVHVNALCHEHTIGGHLFGTQREALAWAVAQIKKQGGLALVNHPNWDWALTADDLPAARGASLLEIWTGHPHVRTLGDEGHLSHEGIWDVAYARGLPVAGVGVDDAHAYAPNAPEGTARPGRAWVHVYGAELTRRSVCAALAAGRLYASTGVTLERIAVTEDTYAVFPAERDVTVEFVGYGGLVLASSGVGEDGAARYQLGGGEVYVRARLTSRDGRRAWTQPSRLAE